MERSETCLLRLETCLLSSPGEQVSLETRNKLLALVAYHGLGSSWAAEADAKDVTHFDGDMNWWPRKNTDDSSPAEQDQGQDLIPEEKLSKVCWGVMS